MGYIYVLQNKINSKCYVGQTNNFKLRISQHKYDAFRKNIKLPLYNAIRKYGFNNFNIHNFIIPNNMLDYFEINVIKRLNAISNGYNIEPGGKKRKTVSKETREKISKAKKGKKMSDEARIKMINSKTGVRLSEEHKKKLSENNAKYWLGKKMKQEIKNKISISNKGSIPWNKDIKGNKLSEEHKNKISKALKGIKHTKEWNKKISESQKGKNIPSEIRIQISKTLTGKKQSEERKKKHSKTMEDWWEHNTNKRKQINQYDLNGNLIKKYKSIREAEKMTKINRSSIILAYKKKQLYAGGFIWKLGG